MSSYNLTFIKMVGIIFSDRIFHGVFVTSDKIVIRMLSEHFKLNLSEKLSWLGKSIFNLFQKIFSPGYYLINKCEALNSAQIFNKQTTFQQTFLEFHFHSFCCYRDSHQ